MLAGVFVTAFYSFRMYFLVFHGKERFDQNPDAHHDDARRPRPTMATTTHHEPHESPWVVTAPLLLLALPSVVIGFLTIEPMLFGDFFKDAIFVDAEKHPAMEELAKEFHGPAQMALHGLTTPPFWLALAGVALAWYMYMVNPALPAAIKARVRADLHAAGQQVLHGLVQRERARPRRARCSASACGRAATRRIIDGVFVNGSRASWSAAFAGVVRWVQSGYIYHYAFAMILGVFVLMTYFVWLNR